MSHRVVIAGGGVGGLEAVLALQSAARDRIELTLVNTTTRFSYRPWWVVSPFDGSGLVEIDLRAFAADRGITLEIGRIESIDADRHVAYTTSGDLHYDSLVLATGALPVSAVPGAISFDGPGAIEKLAEALRTLPPAAAVAFVATPAAVWTLPLYELALQTTAKRPDLDVAIVTSEAEPLIAFGSSNSARVRTLLGERGVELHTATVAEDFDEAGLFIPMAGILEADLAVALPALIGGIPHGVPMEPGGFVPVDDHCRVDHLESVYVIGDLAARPLKQGGLAAQQADVAAAAIARAAGAIVEVRPYEPILRAMLMTGQRPMYLRYPETPGGGDVGGAPWWPPHKIAAAHLGPYLATHAELLATSA